MALPERGRFGLVPALPWTEMKEAEPFGQTLLSSSTSTNASTIIVKLPAHQLNSHTPPTTRTFVMKPTPRMLESLPAYGRIVLVNLAEPMQTVALPIYSETVVRVATSRDRHRTHAIEFYQRPEESLELIYRRASSFFLILAACCDERRKKGVSNLVELLGVDVGIHKSNDLTLVAPVKSVNQVPTGFQLLLTLFVRRKIANGFCLGSLKRAKPTGKGGGLRWVDDDARTGQCWLNFGAKWGVGGLLVEDTTCCCKLLPATRGHVP
uniref:Uncharacterized protein n=1 Tax=Vespula pensylvanica TaxID=30213 RepID=A0A834U457_VESPE|nr:hypothetical protein H0235_012253 [Vespula pensylvanica]